jgi:dTDP-4-dehydrorhamnose reductase
LLGSESGLGHEELSITDASAVEAIIAARKPAVVFNCAAYNAVDRAESERAAAIAVNSDGPFNLAAACRRHGTSMVHFSTNFVFSGAGAEPYVESDEPSPLSVYGRSKLDGERRVLEVGTHVLVIRTAGVFGGPNSFPSRILKRARAGETLRFVSDQTVNPTYAKDLAGAALELAEEGFAGIVHAVADGCPSWDEFARTVLFEAGVQSQVHSVKTGDYPAQARRPANGCLGTIRFRALRPWRDAVRDWLKNP